MPSKDSQKTASQAQSLSTFLSTAIHSLTHPESNSAPPKDDATAPLSLLHDSALLLKANTTKLGIALKPPATHDAVQKLLSEIGAGILPSILYGVELCTNTSKHGEALLKEVRLRVRYLFEAFKTLLNEIEEKALNAEKGTERDSQLKSIGVVWERADNLSKLKAIGLTGVVAEKIKSSKGIIEDAESELRDYIEGQDMGDGWSDDEEDEDDNPPKDSSEGPPNKAEAEKALKRIRTYSILLSALLKRRLTLGTSSVLVKDVARLDRLPTLAMDVVNLADDMVIAYSDDKNEEGVSLLFSAFCRKHFFHWMLTLLLGRCHEAS